MSWIMSSIMSCLRKFLGNARSFVLADSDLSEMYCISILFQVRVPCGSDMSRLCANLFTNLCCPLAIAFPLLMMSYIWSICYDNMSLWPMSLLFFSRVSEHVIVTCCITRRHGNSTWYGNLLIGTNYDTTSWQDNLLCFQIYPPLFASTQIWACHVFSIYGHVTCSLVTLDNTWRHVIRCCSGDVTSHFNVILWPDFCRGCVC